MTDVAAPRPLDEVDFQVIYARSIGMTWDEAGRFVQTVGHPNGITEKTCRNRYKDNQLAFDRLISKFSGPIRAQMEEFKAITKDEYREKLAAMRAKGAKTKELALDYAISNPTDATALTLGVKVADSLEDREFGKASQVHKVSGEHTVNHLVFNPQPVRQLAAQEVDMLNSKRLLDALPADVLEAEVVEPT